MKPKVTIRAVDNSAAVLRAFDTQLQQGLEAIGIAAQKHAATPKKKGGDMPVDTGRLRDSVTHAVQGKSVYIGTNVVYAPVQEYRNHFLKNAAANHKDEYERIMKAALKD